jgi:hypothetical protein
VSAECHVADIGPVRACLLTGYAGLPRYLGEFYPLAPCGGDVTAEWTIEARLAVPEPGMAPTPRGAGWRADRGALRAVVSSASPRDLAITVRETISEVLLGYREAHGYTMLRASAVTNGRRVVIVADGKGSGKTALALSALLADGYRLVADDHLLTYRTTEGLVVTPLPAPVQVAIGTYLDYASHLGEPQESEGTGIEALLQMPRRERYAIGARLLCTYRSLSQDSPTRIVLSSRDVTVVLSRQARRSQYPARQRSCGRTSVSTGSSARPTPTTCPAPAAPAPPSPLPPRAGSPSSAPSRGWCDGATTETWHRCSARSRAGGRALDEP